MRARAAALIVPALVLALMSALVLASAAGAETLLLPAGAASGASQSDPIYQVACPAAGDCVGVGAYIDTGNHNQALIETERGGAWSGANVPDGSLPHAGAVPDPYLTGVACTAVGSCVSVDAYDDSGGNEQGLIDVESGGGWAPIEAPLAGLQVASNPGVEVADVACPASDACVGIGSYVSSDTYEQGLIETQSAGGWSAAAMPMPGNAVIASDPNFYDISCAGTGNCAAVGYYTDSLGNQQGLLETDSGGVWQSAQELDLADLHAAANPEASVSDVSCTAAGSCTAVGSYEDASGTDRPFAVQELAGQWQPAVELTLPGNASGSAVGSGGPQSDLFVNGVACASTGNCTAVGSYDATAANDVEPFTLTESGGSWGAGTELTLPADGPAAPAANPEAALYSVTCSGAGTCLAAGTYVAGAGANAALVARESGGSWTAAAADLGSGYDADRAGLYWADVTCASGGYCAIGGYVADNASGNQVGFLLDSPGAPAGVNVTLSGAQSSVSWPVPRDNGGLPIAGYTVTANDLTYPPSGGQTVSVAGSVTSATVSGLTPSDSYTFTVTASSLVGNGVPVTSATVSAASPHASAAPSRAQIRASLKPLLRPKGRAARLRALRRSHRYVFRYRALEGGRVSVRWYQLIRTRGHHSHRRLVASSGAAKVAAAKTIKLTVRLNRAGRKLVADRARHRLRLTAVVSFTAAGARAVTRTGSFTLR
ncbi:MAG TPA: fibronectin type III domain-containing protein [Solirubrobacteraceae bacterium]|jgi:hypothetical protein|nr:fibronectin type III domain-containing protein [Solirubrobacteraceae bacterium]